MGYCGRIVNRKKPVLNKRQIKLVIEIVQKIPEAEEDKELFADIFEFINDTGCTVDDYIEHNQHESKPTGTAGL